MSRRSKRTMRHLLLAVTGASICLTTAFLLTPGSTAQTISLGTAYASLIFVALTLSLGPLNVIRSRPTPTSRSSRPYRQQLQTLLTRIITRLLKILTRQGPFIEEDTRFPYLTNLDGNPALAPLHAAACTYRIALGPRAGQKVLTWKEPSVRLASPEAPPPQGCVSAQGFSLHADTQRGPHQRHTLERLCRYIIRPALGHKRLSHTRASAVVLQLKTPYRDGTTHLVMTPLEFLQRLAALVPRPRLHLIRFHGVLAPNATLRAQIVPGGPEHATDTADEHGNTPYASTRSRLSWAQLLKRVFEIDMASCPQRSGPLTIIAAIKDPAVMAKILIHLGFPTRAPPRSPAQLCTLFQTA